MIWVPVLTLTLMSDITVGRMTSTVLIVTTHPDRSSETWRLTESLAAGVTEAGGNPRIHDLWQNGFQPAFGPADLAAFRRQRPPPQDVLDEQQLIEQVDAVVAVFPVYWWSVPALLAGWIERVFTGGWAYEDSADVVGFRTAVPDLHFVGVAGVNENTFVRRGYHESLTTRLLGGLADYSGITNASLTLLYDSHAEEADVHARRLQEAHETGLKITAAISACPQHA